MDIQTTQLFWSMFSETCMLKWLQPWSMRQASAINEALIKCSGKLQWLDSILFTWIWRVLKYRTLTMQPPIIWLIKNYVVLLWWSWGYISLGMSIKAMEGDKTGTAFRYIIPFCNRCFKASFPTLWQVAPQTLTLHNLSTYTHWN